MYFYYLNLNLNLRTEVLDRIAQSKIKLIRYLGRIFISVLLSSLLVKFSVILTEPLFLYNQSNKCQTVLPVYFYWTNLWAQIHAGIAPEALRG